MSEFTKKDTYAEFLGIKYLSIEEGAAQAEMEITPHHLNGAGTVHGGAIFSLGDAVFGAASNSRGGLAMAINVSISFFKAIKEGKLLATAEEISLHKKLATYLIKISDDRSNLIALFQGTVYRKDLTTSST
ncbi:MAG: PaaI family thioesterase [Bacteroidota bacterium]